MWCQMHIVMFKVNNKMFPPKPVEGECEYDSWVQQQFEMEDEDEGGD